MTRHLASNKMKKIINPPFIDLNYHCIIIWALFILDIFSYKFNQSIIHLSYNYIIGGIFIGVLFLVIKGYRAKWNTSLLISMNIQIIWCIFTEQLILVGGWILIELGIVILIENYNTFSKKRIRKR